MLTFIVQGGDSGSDCEYESDWETEGEYVPAPYPHALDIEE